MSPDVPTCRLLIVDDNEGDYFLAREMLRAVDASPYQVDWASSFDTGLAAIEEARHDAYLVDHNLGGRTGVELLEAARRRGVTGPVIMLTGIRDPAVDQRALVAGAADYLVKDELTPALLDRSVRYSLERHRLMVEMEVAANHDTLTGLANRRYFQEFLEGALARSERSDQCLGLLAIDLDNFKQINDRRGHAAGDAVLVAVARLIQACVRRGDLVARVGGDEFAVVLADIVSVENAQRVARKILSSFAESPVVLQGRRQELGASIGVSITAGSGTDLTALVKSADTAMYVAKSKGRNNFQIFEDPMQAAATRRAELHDALARAVRAGTLQLAYQPQVAAANGRLLGLEALVRWNRRGSPVSPAEFIPIAEETGLIRPLGRWVLEHACEQHQRWRADGLIGPGLTLAVNISAVQLTATGGFVQTLVDALERTEMRAQDVELEITETAIMRDPERAIEELQRIRQLGVRIALDDFGTGYSSLSHLKRLPIQTIKVDRSFVHDAPRSAQDAVLVKAALALADALGLTSVAEGVETAEQRDFLIANGCGVMQGFLFHPPLGAAAIEPLLAAARGEAA